MRRAPAVALLLLCALAIGAVPPPDPLVVDQWHLPHVGAFDSWDRGQGGGVVVAVVDTGVDRTHPDLAGRVAGGIDLVDPGTPPDDPNGHGTLVAGVVAAVAGNDVGGVGVAPAATIMPVRVLGANGSGSSRNVAEGILWAARNGAHVINLSLAEAPGLVVGNQGVISREVEDAIAQAHAAGVLVVAAAGNEGRSQIPYSETTPVVIVGASDRNDGIWPGSNRDARTLFAPGVEIVSTYTGHGFARADGTSFATPIVSAGAAILRASGLSADDIRNRLYATARPVAAGRGRVDLAAATAGATAAGPAPAPSPTVVPSATPEAPAPATAPPPPVVPDPRVVPAPTVPLPDRPARAPEPDPLVPEPLGAAPEATPSPEGRDVALDVPAPVPQRVGTGDDGGAPVAFAAGLAVLLVAVNVTGHVLYATSRRTDGPLVVWRR